MSLRIDRDQAGLFVVPLESSNPPRGQRRVKIEYTLCDLRDEPVAVSGVGVIDAQGDEAEGGRDRVAVLTDELQDELFVSDSKVIPLTGFDDPLKALLVPLVVEGLVAIDSAAPDVGWDCIIVGSGVRSEVLRALAPFAGARRIVSIPDPKRDLGGVDLAADGPGTAVFLVAVGENRTIGTLLPFVPENSVVVLLGGEPGEPTGVSFYEEIHRKNVKLVGTAYRASAKVARRATDLIRSRLRLDDLEPPVVPVFRGAKLEVESAQWLVFAWPQGSKGPMWGVREAPDR